MKIKVCPDFESTGLWDENEFMVEYTDVCVPKELIDKFEKWLEFYEDICHDSNYAFVEGTEVELNKIGFELAKELKKCNPMVDIEYMGEAPECMLESVTI